MKSCVANDDDESVSKGVSRNGSINDGEEEQNSISSASAEGSIIDLNNPNENDVCLTTKKRAENKVGHGKYWDYLISKLPDFKKCVDDEPGQFKLAQNIIDYVEKSNGGRFIQPVSDKSAIWATVPNEVKLHKVRRALKEKFEREGGRKTKSSYCDASSNISEEEEEEEAQHQQDEERRSYACD